MAQRPQLRRSRGALSIPTRARKQSSRYRIGIFQSGLRGCAGGLDWLYPTLSDCVDIVCNRNLQCRHELFGWRAARLEGRRSRRSRPSSLGHGTQPLYGCKAHHHHDVGHVRRTADALGLVTSRRDPCGRARWARLVQAHTTRVS